MALTERASVVSTEYRDAISKVRDTISGVPCLRDEEWSSLTRHVTELHVLDRFGYLKCCSADSVVDGIIPLEGEEEIEFDPLDESFLSERGIQVKGSRHKDGRRGTTGDIKLSSRFKFLFIVWVNASYQVEEVYRLEYDAVNKLIVEKRTAKPCGKNTAKLTYAEAKRIGSEMVLSIEDDRATLTSAKAARRRARERVRRFVAPGAGLSEELMAERKKEARRE